MHRSFVILLPTLLFACSEPATDTPSTSAGPGNMEGAAVFEGLLGEWQDPLDTAGTTFHEQWTRSADGAYTGLGFVLSGNDTVFIEHLAIVQSDTGTYYAANTPDQNDGATVHFKLIHHEDSLVFANPAHDFPQRIVYTPGPADDWNVTVSGMSKGTYAVDRYHFTRRTPGPTATVH